MARKRLNLTLSESEFELLEKVAEQHKMTPHELAKTVIFQDIEKTEMAKFQRAVLKNLWGVSAILTADLTAEKAQIVKEIVQKNEQEFFKLEGK